MKKKIFDIILIILKIFIVGLLLQFFLQTLVNFGLNLQGGIWSVIWLWKELVVIGFFCFLIFYAIKKKGKIFSWVEIKKFIKKCPIRNFIRVFLATLLITFIISFFTADISRYIISIRYSMFGFFTFIVFFFIGQEFLCGKINNLKRFFIKLFKWILGLGFFWWFMLWIAPGSICHFGYTLDTFEGEVGSNPPAVYYSEYKTGVVRNQFLFERPINFGFFLVAFWPLLFVLVFSKKKFVHALLYTGIFGLLVFSTVSRAAWGARGVQTIILYCIFFWQYLKKYKYCIILLVIPFLFCGLYLMKDKFLSRQYSDTGHLKEVEVAIEMIEEKPLLGQGPASAGPASHHLEKGDKYNPENQYLQIWIEYGLFGFMLWMYLYIFLHIIGIKSYKFALREKKSKYFYEHGILMFALSLGLIGLSIEGFVLHSFVDRMVVYPFMAILGICYASFLYEKNKHK